jgi:hypothetical protein
MSRAVMQQALEFIESHSKYWNGSADHPQTIVESLRAELAEPEQAAIDAYRKIIKALAELVTMRQTDKQYTSDVLSRPDVMEKVTSIRYYACDLFHSAHLVITKAKQ